MQFFKDLSLKMRKDKRTQFFLIVLVVIGIVGYMSNRQRPGAPRLNLPEGGGGSPVEERYQDLLTRFGEDLRENTAAVGALRKDIDEQRSKSLQFEERTAEIFKKLLARMGEMEERQNSFGRAGTSPADVGPEGLQNIPPVGPDEAGPGSQAALGDELTSFGLERQEPVPPAPVKERRTAFIGTGDSVRVKLLAGVNAPTRGAPYPVVFKTLSEVYGPDGSALPIGEARMVAAAQGNLSDSRALFRLTSLNLRLPNGQRQVLSIDGWVVGEDGIRGLKGILIDTFGEAIAGVGLAAGIGGLGSGLSAAQLEERVTENGTSRTFLKGNLGNFVLGNSLSGAAAQYARLVRERFDILEPLVQVLSGREATAIFSQNVEVPFLYELYGQEDTGLQSLD